MNEHSTDATPTNVEAASGWQAVIDDMAAMADEYEDRGWTTLELHPGDSVLVDSEARTGLDVVLPGPEYEDLEALVDDRSFTDVSVFRAEDGGMVYLLIVEEDPDDETAAFVPAYYDPAGSQDKLETIQDDDQLRLFCRRLDNDYVEFVHTDPTPFLPVGLTDA